MTSRIWLSVIDLRLSVVAATEPLNLQWLQQDHSA